MENFYKKIPCIFFSNFKLKIGFFSTSKKNLECSKINEIYFFWTLSEPILSKIWDIFFFRKKGLCSSRILKKNSKISNLNRIFFHIFWAKSDKIRFPVWKLGFLMIFFQIPPTTETFFFEKKVSQILLKIGSDEVQRK